MVGLKQIPETNGHQQMPNIVYCSKIKEKVPQIFRFFHSGSFSASSSSSDSSANMGSGWVLLEETGSKPSK